METTADITTDKAQVVRDFFALYNAQKPFEAIQLTAPGAQFNYVPLGPSGIGTFDGWAQVAAGLIGAFPDLHNEVKYTRADNEGNIYAEVWIGGRHELDFGPLVAKQRTYWLEHLFILHVNDEGLIDHMTCYWDNYTWFKQLDNIEAFANVTW
jgi:hypothetical protein